MSQDTALPAPIDSELIVSTNRIAGFKGLLHQYQKGLADDFRAGAPVLNLIASRTDFVDALLTRCWEYFTDPYQNRLALIAAGGYGRRELHPHSDIDIVVLLDTKNRSTYRNALESFFTFLWDIGLKPGHSVCTIDECVEQAENDQSSMTRLMESRLIAGASDLFDEVKSKIAPDRIWPSDKFFRAKMEEQAARYKKFDDTAYKLEPNVKEGPGGLRDIQVIAWTIKRHYNSPTLYELVKYHCLTQTEYDEFMEAQVFLWRVRYALHIITDRAEDRLVFDHQIAVAEVLGYHDTKENKAVENFMQQYYRTVTRVERLNEMLLQLFSEDFLKERENCQTKAIDRQFQSKCDFLEVRHENVFSENPLALLEIFLVLQLNPKLKGVHASTIRVIRQNLGLIDEKFRSNKKANVLFMEILRQPGGVTHQLRRMNRYGVLAAYLPEFAQVVGRMQYDLFHVYTVDEHSLFVVRNLRRFALQKHHKELPFCNDVFLLIPKPELLYLAGLLHDIGKGRGGDHSNIGEDIASTFCKQHGLNETDTRMVTWLVRHHLIMSMTAQRKDIQSPDIIHEFASHVGNQETLNYLYLLTVADIRATNPTLWNSWIDSLLKELYMETHRAFRRGLDNPIEHREKIKAAQEQARKLLSQLGLPKEDAKNVWRTISEDYFLRYSVDESAWHTIAISACKPADLPLALLRPQSQHGTAEVFLYTKNRDFIFSTSTGVLDRLGLTILNARIITTHNGYVLNSYQILEQSGDAIQELHREHRICVKLREAMKNPGPCAVSGDRNGSRTLKHFTVKPQVIYHDDPQNRYTILELLATDRPGLLMQVGQAFDQTSIRLHQAKITTIGSRAEDLFYVTDKNDRPLVSEGIKGKLKKAVIDMVGNTANQS